MDLKIFSKVNGLEQAIIIIILIAAIGKFFVIPFNQGLWWDEAVYLGLGTGISNGYYSLWPGTIVESFRPPLYPIVISLFSFSIPLVRIISAMLSVISILMVYKISKNIFNRNVALWTALFYSTNCMFIFFSIKALSESLLLFLFSLSLLIFLKWEKTGDDRFLLISGVLLGLSFITRYLTAAVILAYIIYFVANLILSRRAQYIKHLIILILGTVIGVIPLMLLNISNFGTPFAGSLLNLYVFITQGSSGIPAIEGVLQFFGIMGLMMIFGVAYLLKDYIKRLRNNKLLGIEHLFIIAIFISVLTYVMISRKEPRHFLTYLPILSVLAGYGMVRFMKNLKTKLRKTTAFLVVILVCISLGFGLYASINDTQSASALVRASEDIRDIVPKENAVITSSFPYVFYISQRNAVTFCGHQEPTDEFWECRRDMMTGMHGPGYMYPVIIEHNVSHVLVYKFEPENPPYANTYFKKVKKYRNISSYYQWGDPEAAIIYEYIK
jgi:4-amino-4-deoxy-L-arabinose transferase-like glycosyltransferase